MGGFERKPGGSTLVQQQNAPSRDLSPGKRTLTEQIHEDPASTAVPAAISTAPLTDGEMNELLSEQDEADAIDDTSPLASMASDNSDPIELSLGPPDGVPLAGRDHATHWGSAQQRVDWVRENFSRARFSSAAEKRYYEDVLASGVAQSQDHDNAEPTAPTGTSASAARYVWTVSFVSPGVLGPMIREHDGWSLQTAPDPSAGYNFDTYLYDAGRGARIPAKALGGTRYRVMMGSAECPGCHFGHGLEVDLYGQNFMEIVGMMAAGGAGVLGGGEPIPMEGETPMAGSSEPVAPRPAGPPNLRVIEGGGGAPIVPRSSPMIATEPRYTTAGNAALQVEPAMQATPQAATSPRPHLSLVPEAAPPPETAAGPRTRPSAAQSGPGRLPAMSPSTAKRPTGRTKPQDVCPPGSHTIKWPFPIWTSLGYGDTGARAADNNHPSTPTLTRVYKPKRNPLHRRRYLTRNAALFRSLYQRGVRGAVHHKIPLYVSGPDSVDNLVFLSNAQHSQWHTQLARQGSTGWMPFDAGGTVYCVL